jgi:hypothetical protein
VDVIEPTVAVSIEIKQMQGVSHYCSSWNSSMTRKMSTRRSLELKLGCRKCEKPPKDSLDELLDDDIVEITEPVFLISTLHMICCES